MSANPNRTEKSTIKSPARLSHAVLRTTRLKEMVEWYGTVLGAKVMYQNEFIAFMTYDDEHHRIALAAFPGLIDKPKRTTGLDHLAFFYETLGDWITNYERLKEAEITPRVCIHHGITMSLYYRDPDDNGVELSIDSVPKAEWHSWMQNRLGENVIGGPLDPDDIARKYHAGVPEEELRHYDPKKPVDMAVIRRLAE
jgi:catechol-2,3-dioxygenase